MLFTTTGTVIWFTGLSGSGKTTVSRELAKRLEALGRKVEIIDGDDIRGGKHKNLKFSREDIRENNRLIAALAKEKMKESDFVLVSIIAPYAEDRDIARSIIGQVFVELHVDASLEKCIERDVKGLYKKALAGEITDFIGLSESNPYEKPMNPDITVESDKASIDDCVNAVMKYLIRKALVNKIT